ncbi:MAG: hypothetical protein WB952_05305 [Terriglobales bacterium]
MNTQHELNTSSPALASGNEKPYTLPRIEAGFIGMSFAVGFPVRVPETCVAPCLWCGRRVAAVIVDGTEQWLEIDIEFRGSISANASPVHVCAGQERWREFRDRDEVPAFYPGKDEEEPESWESDNEPEEDQR